MLLSINLRRKLRRLRELSGKQIRYVGIAWFALPVVWLALRAAGLARTLHWLDRSPRRVATVAQVQQARALGEAVNIAASYTLFSTTCLSRSLLLHWLLRLHGIVSELRIGVQMVNCQLRAHAWTECAGVPVNDAVDIANQFSTFDTLVPLSAFDDTRHATTTTR